MYAKFALPALALAGTALAQSCSGDLTILTSDDASALQNCQTYQGNVIISSAASGQIQLNGVQSINGDLRCINASQVTSISADQLATITGTFDLEEIQILSSLNFASLNGVKAINWIALPQLQALTFRTGVSQANTVYISNTGLTSLQGIELTQVGSMNVNNNQYLKTINVNSLTNVTNALSFAANGPNLSIQFPNLLGAANLTFRDVSSISMPSLASVAGAMGFYSNAFSSFAAPNLTQTGGTIAFVDSSQLSNLSFPSLTIVGGGIQLANNSQLLAVNGFPDLMGIGGDINFYGTFNTVTFPALADVRGAANVYTSSQNTQICTVFQDAKSHQVIKGKLTCQTNSARPDTNGSSTTSSSGSSSSSTKSGASSSLINYETTASFTGLAALIAAFMLF